MFKVICIDAAIRNDELFQGILIEGCVYTVNYMSELSRNRFGVIENHPVYGLVEFTDNDCFGVERFIPLSEIDELQLVNEKQLVNK